MAADPNSQNLAATVAEVSERAALLVREEIELAKAEVAEKAKKLVKGIVIGGVAGVFLLTALLFALHGVAWLLWFELPTGSTPNYFWGFFALAVILVVLGVLAGYIAYRALRAGAPPTPAMAIDEARKIRETVSAPPAGAIDVGAEPPVGAGWPGSGAG